MWHRSPLDESLFAFACVLERILDFPALQKARVHIIGAYRKQKMVP